MVAIKRVFLLVLDSLGIGALPDAHLYGDAGCNTLRSISRSANFEAGSLRELGLFNIDGVTCGEAVPAPSGAFARLAEVSKGKDTTIGHWEIAGVESKRPLPTYPNGFPEEVIRAFEAATGRKTLCNLPYSGTDVIRDYGERHMQTGDLIVYTSADSVFQVAAHEDVVPIEQLYEYCEQARAILTGEHAVGRVIARPFVGQAPNFTRTSNRHDFSLAPPATTMLDELAQSGKDVLSVGKIVDIFAGRGITDFVRTRNNDDGIARTLEMLDRDFEGLCFVNLVDFDMVYGHRNDVDGYAKALASFDRALEGILAKLRAEDILMITADHGCDPGDLNSTDHTREYTPFIIYGKNNRICI